MQNIITEVEKYLLDNVPHNWDKDTYLEHIDEVRNYATTLAKEHGVDSHVLDIAALLHDIGYGATPDGKGHASISSELARTFLSKFKISPENIDLICGAIENHSMGSANENQDVGLIDQILRDADGIAFLKKNVPYFHKVSLEENGAEVAKEKTLNKIDGMGAKVKTDLGTKIAEEFFTIAKDWISKK